MEVKDDFEDLYYESIEQRKELEAKLAEKDIEIDDLKRDYIPKLEFGLQRANKMGKKLDVENEQLKQQLAEKEQEIENIKQQFAIDYAIEQLEELRLSFVCNYHDNISWIDDRENSCCLNLTTTIYNTTMDIFDNLIKQLKEKKDE